MWEEWFKALLGVFIAFYMNSGRNPEYREVRSGKKSEMRIFKIYGTRPSFSIFSVNNRDGTLIFGMDVEIGCVLKNK